MADPVRPPTRRLPLALAAAAAVAAVLVPLVPPGYRPANVAAFGAVAAFAAVRGGRLGGPVGLALAVAGKLAVDLIQYARTGFDPACLPMASVYAGLAGYAVVGAVVRRWSDRPGGVLTAALAGGAWFFLWTNFWAWRGMALPYDGGPAGLLQSYRMAVPFHRGTLLSDAGFAAGLCLIEWAVARSAVPAAAPVAVTPSAAGR